MQADSRSCSESAAKSLPRVEGPTRPDAGCAHPDAFSGTRRATTNRTSHGVGQRGEMQLMLTLTCECSRDPLWRGPYITEVTRFPPAETLA